MKSRSLFDVINGHKKPAKAKKLHFKPVAVGHLLAIKVYKKGIYLDVIFADHIDICGSHTMIHYNERAMEEHPYRLLYSVIEPNAINVIYENETEFQIIRIN